jgi:ATP-binding cassette subfamily B protein
MPEIRARLRRVLSQTPHLRRGIRLIWEAAPRHTLLWVLLLVIQGLLPAIQVLLTRPLVDGLAAALDGDPAALRSSLLVAAAMAGLLVAAEVLRGLSGYLRAAQGEAVRDHVSGLIHRQSMAVDLAFHDQPEYFDHMHRARREAATRPLALLESAGSAFQNVITLAAIARVLASYGLWLPVLLVISTLPAGLVVLDATLRMHAWRRRSTEDERRSWYYEWLLTSRDAAAEMRLYELGAGFAERFRELRRRLKAERLALARRQALTELAAAGLALALVAAALGWRLASAFGSGGVSLGDLALFWAAFQQGQSLARGLLSNLGQILQSSLFLGDLFEFLELEPSVADSGADKSWGGSHEGDGSRRRDDAAAQGDSSFLDGSGSREGSGGKDDSGSTPVRSDVSPASSGARVLRPPRIRFENLRFRYPRAEQLLLDGFNLEIPAGRKLAILGSNGAGKSTLLKLLCRFYDPEAGGITFDGVDIREIPLTELRAQLSVLFQMPIRFLATAGESIALGQPGLADMAGRVREAANLADAGPIIERLPQGFDTPLGIGFVSGVELSVGEWQRIALARACYRASPILVLDEPTSAMDPWAELAWMRRFDRLAADRTALLITHRLASARFAEEIIVMEKGCIQEEGDHASLLAAGGRYAELWAAGREG